MCFFLGPLDGQCKDMIDTYFPKMWQLLQEELVSQPASRYKLIKMTASHRKVADTDIIPLNIVLTDSNIDVVCNFSWELCENGPALFTPMIHVVH